MTSRAVTKVTFNATRRAIQAVDTTAVRITASKTDVLNRAAILYERFTALEEQGADIHAVFPDGKVYRLILI